MNFANDTRWTHLASWLETQIMTALVQFGLDHNFDISWSLEGWATWQNCHLDRCLASYYIHKEADGSYFIAVIKFLTNCSNVWRVLKSMGKFVLSRMKIRKLVSATNKDLQTSPSCLGWWAYKTSNEIPTLESEIVESDLIFSVWSAWLTLSVQKLPKLFVSLSGKQVSVRSWSRVTTKIQQRRLLNVWNHRPNDTEDHVFTGAELNELSDEEFQKSSSNILSMRVYHLNTRFGSWKLGKWRVVVAMTGDKSTMHHHLRQLDIGIGMGLQVQKFLRSFRHGPCRW